MLAIDIGNSRIKWAFFEGEAVQSFLAVEYTLENFESVLKEYKLPEVPCVVAVSLVGGDGLKKALIRWLSSKGFSDVRFARTLAEQCGLVNAYSKPKNMGVDRWLAMIAGFRLSSLSADQVLCVIDCGTAITVDFVNASGQHLGGLILPGYRTMLQSLIKGADGIQFGVHPYRAEAGPSLSSVLSLGSDTREAVEQGCAQQVVFGLSGVVENQQRILATKINCIVTGGDGVWVAELLRVRNECFPYLVLQGLHAVYKNDELLG